MSDNQPSFPYTPVSFSALPLISSVSPTDETLVVQAGVAKRARFNSLPTAPAGPPGPQGPPGTQILTGSASPTTALGSNGDIYIQINNGDFYRKVAGTWNLIGNIKGPQGEPGQPGQSGQQGRTPEFLFGVGEPNSSIGINGDVFIDTETGGLYYKNNNNWTFQLTIKGAPGSKIFSGNTPPATTLGNPGDYYINTTNGNLFRKESGDWVLIYNLGGSNSGDGSGNTVFITSEIPSDVEGNNGDISIYIGVDPVFSGSIYRKENSSWLRTQTKVLTPFNKLQFFGFETSQSQRWEMEFIEHGIFDLSPELSQYYISLNPVSQFYYEVIAYNNTLRVRVNKQPGNEFVIRLLHSEGATSFHSNNHPNSSYADITISTLLGERICFRNLNPFYGNNEVYFIEFFQGNIFPRVQVQFFE